jgi:hypothetical protein
MPAWRLILAITIFAAILFYIVQIQTAPALAGLGLRNPAELGFSPRWPALAYRSARWSIRVPHDCRWPGC